MGHTGHTSGLRTLLAGLLAAGAISSTSAAVIRSASGLDTASITGALNDFRADLGTLNPNNPGSLGSGRREINWDAVPDSFSAPNLLPADFFNGAAAPRARGAVFSTPGSGFAVSADSDNPTATPRDFANINSSYADQFEQFSPQRLFTALGSNETEVRFFIPGSNTPALTRGFGAIFSDVDVTGNARIEYYDSADQLLLSQDVLGTAGLATFSFLGASFDNAIVARVKIVSGTHALDADNNDNPLNGVDVAVMDDFVYGEPVVPEPTTLSLLTIGALALMRRR